MSREVVARRKVGEAAARGPEGHSLGWEDEKSGYYLEGELRVMCCCPEGREIGGEAVTRNLKIERRELWSVVRLCVTCGQSKA